MCSSGLFKMSSRVFENPGMEERCALLRRVKNIAVVGLSPNPARPSHGVAQAMQGIVNEPAARRAREGGMSVVMDRCIYSDFLLSYAKCV